MAKADNRSTLERSSSSDLMYWHVLVDNVGGGGVRHAILERLGKIRIGAPVRAVAEDRYKGTHELSVIVDGLGLTQQHITSALDSVRRPGLKYQVAEY